MVRPDDDEAGFTLLEIMIVLFVLSIVMTICGFGLISLSNTASRTDSMVTEEQSASTVLAQLTEDIRSAITVTFPSGASPSSEVELTEVGTSSCSTTSTTTNIAGQTNTLVLWVYDSGGKTLTREQQNSSCAWVQSGVQLTRVANTTSQPVFSYSDDAGNTLPIITPAASTPLSSTYATQIASNATSVSVNLYVQSSATNVATLDETDVVALTNQLQTLNASGQGT